MLDKVLKGIGVLSLVVVLTAASNYQSVDSPKGPWEFHQDMVNGRGWTLNTVTGQVFRIKSDGKSKVYKLEAEQATVNIK